MSIKKIDHVVITTADIESCLNFYQKIGFTAIQKNGNISLFAGDFKINVHIQGHERLPHAHYIQPGSADLCFELSISILEFEKILKKNHIYSESGIVDRSGTHGVMRSIYIYDTDGNLLEFSSYE